MSGKRPVGMLAINRLAGVAPEVDLRESTLDLPPKRANNAEPTAV